MLNEQASRTQPSPPTAEGTPTRVAAKPGYELTAFPDWLNEYLREFAVHTMPGATMTEVVVRCVAVGISALDGVNFADRMAAPAKPAPVPDTDPWEARMYRALRAAAVAAGGSLTVDGAEVMRLAPEATDGQTRRAVGYVIGYRARDYGTVTTRDGVLQIAPIGRLSGHALHQYRLTAVDG